MAANEAAAKRLGEDIRKRNLEKELIGSRIRMECWDSMEVQKKEVSFAKQARAPIEKAHFRSLHPSTFWLNLQLPYPRKGTTAI